MYMMALDVWRMKDARLGPGTWLRAGAVALALAAQVTPAHSEEPTGVERAQIEKQLEQARDHLDEAATQVAELTRKLYGDQEEDVVRFIGRPPHGAMIGINIESDDDADGVRVVGVSPGGPAAAGGIKTGDVI